MDATDFWQKTKRTFSHWSFVGRKRLKASFRTGWWAAYCSVPVLMVTALCAAAKGHVLDFWPFYLSIVLIGLLVRYKDDFAKFASIFVALVAFAYVIYQSQKPTTVVTPFVVHTDGNAHLPFSGETVADVVRDGLDALSKVATRQPGRFPCANSIPPSDISRALSPKDASLDVELQPVFPVLEAVTAPPAPEPVTLQVKGVSLNALLSASRGVLRTERVISGDLITDAGGSFFMIARSSRGDGPWTVGPYITTKQGLQDAGCQMAEYILKDTNPNLLAEAYINANRSTDVIVLYNAQVSADVQNSHDALLLDGAARMQMKNYGAAISRFQAALRTDKDDPRTLESLGLAYAGAGNYDDAFKQFDLALQCPPFPLTCSLRARNYYDRGVTFFLKGDYDDSINAFQEAVRIKPDYPEAMFYLGEAFQETKRYPQAIQQYQTALQSKPVHASDVAIIQLQLGNVLDSNQQPAQAIAAYQQTEAYFLLDLSLDPENLGAYYSFALVDLRIGTVQSQNHLQVAGKNDNGAAVFDRSVHALEYVVSKNAQYAEARTYLARAHMLLGSALVANNYAERAIPELSAAVSQFKELGESGVLFGAALVERGDAYLSDHQDDLAATDSREAIGILSRVQAPSLQSEEVGQWLARALTLAAHVHINKGQYQNAIDELQRALKLFSPYPEANRALGIAYTELGFALVKSGTQADKAQEDFAEAISQLAGIQGVDAEAKSLVGRAYLGSSAAFELQNRHEEAAAACDKALVCFEQVPKMKLLLPKLEKQCAMLHKGR